MKETAKVFEDIMMENDLVYIWRIRNTETRPVKDLLGNKKAQLFKDL